MALNLSTRISIPETLTDNDIVPHALQNRLMYWRDVFRMGQFDIGDIAAEVIESVAARGLGINQDRVMDATGNFCGKSGRTVRYYYETAVFYPPDVRQEFNILPFSHFVFARSTGDHWRRVLEYSMVFPGIGEKGLRAEYLRWLRDFENFSVAAPTYDPDGVVLDSEQEDGELSASGESCETSQDYRVGMHAGIAVVNGVILALGKLESLVSEAEIPGDVKNLLIDAIGVFRRYLPTLARSVVE